MAVNARAIQLHDPRIIDHVAGALKRSGLAPSSLTVEVTETVLADPEAVARVHQLKDSGVRVAIDDSAPDTPRLVPSTPADRRSQDRQEFVDDLGRSADRAVLANVIVRLGRSLGLETVAEGVETLDQLRVLSSIGCEVVQGYLFSPPLPPAEIEFRLLELATATPTLLEPSDEALVRIVVGPLNSSGAGMAAPTHTGPSINWSADSSCTVPCPDSFRHDA